MSRNRKQIRKSNQKGFAGIIIVVAVLLISLSVKSAELKQENHAYAEKEASLKEEIAAEEERADEIKAMEDYMQTDEYIEEMAREKLGLVYQDETVFIPEQ